MDKMSVFAILTMSLPETLLNIYATFLICGLRKFLPGRDNERDRKRNILRYIVTVAVITTFTVLTRRFLYDLNIILIVNTVLMILTLKIVYRISFFKAMGAAVVYPIVLLTIEVLYLTIYANFFELNFSKFYSPSSDLYRLALSLVQNIYQITIILTMWDFRVAFENIKKYNKSKPLVITFFAFLIFMELSYAYMFFTGFQHFSITQRIIGTAGNIIGVFLNLLFFRTYISIVKEVKEKEGVS